MRHDQFAFLQSLLKDRSGLVVSEDKIYLLETRLMPVARGHGFSTIEELVDHYKSNPDEHIAVAITEAMNTHESLFFRDNAPFELFRDTILPELLERRADKKTFRIWCAACSSGQEPYSLAMLLHDAAADLQGWSPEIIATDISNAVLNKAREGRFSQFEVQRGLPVQMLVKHFKQDGEYWVLGDHIRNMVTFRPFNLLHDPKGLGMFDVVFCRNVLIYFDVESKGQVMDRIAKILADDGLLFLGSAESTVGLTESFLPVKAGRGVYRLTDAEASLAEKMD